MSRYSHDVFISGTSPLIAAQIPCLLIESPYFCMFFKSQKWLRVRVSAISPLSLLHEFASHARLDSLTPLTRGRNILIACRNLQNFFWRIWKDADSIFPIQIWGFVGYGSSAGFRAAKVLDFCWPLEISCGELGELTEEAPRPNLDQGQSSPWHLVLRQQLAVPSVCTSQDMEFR